MEEFMKKSLISLASTLIITLASSAIWAQGDPVAGEVISLACAACHDADGNSTLAVNPKLAGQNAKYLLKQMQDFKSGVRVDLIMAAMVGGLSDQQMMDVAAYYESQEVKIEGADPELIALGERIYRSGIKELKLVACTACHSPTGKGNAPAGFPALSGQHSEYTIKQLKDFRSGDRANDGDSGIMREVTERLTDTEIQALASYVSGLY